MSGLWRCSTERSRDHSTTVEVREFPYAVPGMKITREFPRPRNQKWASMQRDLDVIRRAYAGACLSSSIERRGGGPSTRIGVWQGSAFEAVGWFLGGVEADAACWVGDACVLFVAGNGSEDGSQPVFAVGDESSSGCFDDVGSDELVAVHVGVLGADSESLGDGAGRGRSVVDGHCNEVAHLTAVCVELSADR